MRQWLRCFMRGHAWLMQFEPGRLYLVCGDCGQESPGWRFGVSFGAVPQGGHRHLHS